MRARPRTVPAVWSSVRTPTLNTADPRRFTARNRLTLHTVVRATNAVTPSLSPGWHAPDRRPSMNFVRPGVAAV